MPDLTPAQATGAEDDRMRGKLAFFLCGGLFIFVGLSFFKPPQLPGDTVGVILGYFAGWVSAIVGFYWGSSSGSKQKSMQQSPENRTTLTAPVNASTTTVIKTDAKAETAEAKTE